MRGYSDEQLGMFSYVSVEDRSPADHPLRAIRKLVDKALVQISTHLACCYSHTGRPSIAPERLLRALL
ncbi:MAG: IS5/IS1182 family transposase, partial [Sulfurimicrobium sp.]|nr:IS5/IS1182 family transposase [Sulfurimicrobium sp.]